MINGCKARATNLLKSSLAPRTKRQKRKRQWTQRHVPDARSRQSNWPSSLHCRPDYQLCKYWKAFFLTPSRKASNTLYKQFIPLSRNAARWFSFSLLARNHRECCEAHCACIRLLRVPESCRPFTAASGTDLVEKHLYVRAKTRDKLDMSSGPNCQSITAMEKLDRHLFVTLKLCVKIHPTKPRCSHTRGLLEMPLKHGCI